MSLDTVQYEILLGLTEGERPADVLYMCHTVALVMLTGQHDEGDENGFQSDPAYWARTFRRSIRSRYERLLYGAGLVLCPIFEPVKHTKYREYSELMTRTRRGYSGIATAPDLMRDFGYGVITAAERGALDSLAAADEQRLWEILGKFGGSSRERF